MRRTGVLAALAVVLGVASAIAAVVVVVKSRDGNGAPSTQGPGVAPPAATAALDQAIEKTVQAVIVPLTQEEIDQALLITSDDENARAILELVANTGKSVRVVLLTNEGSTVRIGAAVKYTLENPVDLDLVLPKMDFDVSDDASRARGYGLTQVHKRLQGLTKFTLQVDLSTRRVAGFEADEYKADLSVSGGESAQ